MTRKGSLWTSLLLCFSLFVLILDTKTAVSGVSEGIALCLRTIIPSLFPFIVLSTMINPMLLGTSNRIISPLGRFCGIPQGAESLLILGLLGGYPVGAQCVNEACRSKVIYRSTGHRMLAFCNNAGPSFIFGIGSCLFAAKSAVWSTWIIQIVSAVIVGCLIPREHEERIHLASACPIKLPQALEKSIRTMTVICGWVIMFRVILSFITRWILWLLPQSIQILCTGFLELSNGCVNLVNIPNTGMRFVMFNVILSAGGICVAMQTMSAVKDIGPGRYFPGKILQTAITFLLSSFAQFLIFPPQERYVVSEILLACSVVLIGAILYILHKSKKTVAFTRQMLYNTQKC